MRLLGDGSLCSGVWVLLSCSCCQASSSPSRRYPSQGGFTARCIAFHHLRGGLRASDFSRRAGWDISGGRRHIPASGRQKWQREGHSRPQPQRRMEKGGILRTWGKDRGQIGVMHHAADANSLRCRISQSERSGRGECTKNLRTIAGTFAIRKGGVFPHRLKSLQRDENVTILEGDKGKEKGSRVGGHGSGDNGSNGEHNKSMDDYTLAFTALASASILVSYADRGNLASTIVPMGEQFGWSPAFEGLVLSAFFGGYAATQMLGGWLADRYGGKRTLILGLTTWSVFTLITPLAAAESTTALLAARVGLGLGEGFAFPSVHAMIAENVPRKQRSTVVGCVTAASYAGALVAFSVSPAIMRATDGWESVFYAFGGGSLLLIPAWLLLPLNMREGPDGVPEVDKSDDVTEDGPTFAAKFKELASLAVRLGGRKEVWAIVAAQFCQSVGMYGLLSWLPTYLHDARGLASDSPELGTLAATPYAIQAVVGAGAGLIADRLVAEEGWRAKTVRQVMQTVGMLGPAICLCAAVLESRADTSVAWIVLGSGVSAVTLGGVSVNHLDIAPKNAGLLFGAGNTAATIAGLLTVPLCGWLLETYDSWDAVFLLFGLSYAIGAFVFFGWVGDEEI